MNYLSEASHILLCLGSVKTYSSILLIIIKIVVYVLHRKLYHAKVPNIDFLGL